MILTGEDSIRFAKAIYRPTKEQIEERRKALSKLESIKITKTDKGFMAEIKGE